MRITLQAVPIELEDEPGFQRGEQPHRDFYADEHTGGYYLFVSRSPRVVGSPGWYN